MFQNWSIARRLFVGQLVFLLALTAVVGTAAVLDSRDRLYGQAEERMAAIATTIADSPLVLQAAGSSDPSALLQPYARAVMAGARVDFITIMATDRTRWTHPTPSEIGKKYIGSIDQALAGRTYTEITAGTLGPSVRAIVPVRDAAGKVQALVAVGMAVTNLQVALNGRLPAILELALALLLGGSLASWLLGRYLARVTLGWGPERLGQLFVYYESVLHSVRDGLVLVDRNGELVMYNDQAAELLGIAAPVENQSSPRLEALNLPDSLDALLRSGRTARDEIHLTDTRLLVVSQEPARSPEAMPAGSRAAFSPADEASTPPEGKFRKARRPRIGTVTMLQDHTALMELADELRSTRTLTDALRAQTHEHANRIHTLVSLLELGRTAQALEFATADLQLSQQLADEVVSSVDEPVVGALLMGKMSQASERGIELRVNTEAVPSPAVLSAHDAVTILGNLIDNAMDAAAEGQEPRWVEVAIRSTADSLVLEVSDSGSGIDLDEAQKVLAHGYSTKKGERHGRGIGLALVRQSVQRLGGELRISQRQGAVFTITLPRERAASPTGSGTPNGDPAGGPAEKKTLDGSRRW
ncbi:sensor histidine kinase [Paenarthrobacter sp. Z7-10]|uniref:sensor histidine kinase n=1 Tax=Paenarthrobacter sp. Z7-10 TaxID=2787635 RepID=UPI0022A9A6EB|nr:sensor histidine kinase [Paenarthrobacter sp. Z7-10]MCZ2403503.1 sensor histidine kinase [Paenarthrobacter sp. Z7-10]